MRRQICFPSLMNSSYNAKHSHMNLYSSCHLALMLRRCAMITKAIRSSQRISETSSSPWPTFQGLKPEFQALSREHKDIPLLQDDLLTLLAMEHSALHCKQRISLYQFKGLELQMQDSPLPPFLDTSSTKTRAPIHTDHSEP